MVTWGINPGQSVGVGERIPSPESAPEPERPTYREGLAHMGFAAGQPIAGAKIDVVFIGSCTNSRISDLRVAAAVAKGNRVAKGVRAIVVPGSQLVAKEAEAEGLHEVFREAGFEWRNAGCSMCLGMNDDKLKGREMSASTSNRNFIGRQGSPTGRTLLMSPAMAAAAALTRRGHRRAGDDEMSDSARRQVAGRGIPVPGNDIDTDRIIPARFLKTVTNEGLGLHAFEDARKQDPEHPFNQKAYEGASVLVGGHELRLRVLARARAGVAQAVGHQGHRGRLLRRDLLRQLHHARHPVPRPSPRTTCSGCSARSAAIPKQAVTVDVERQEVRVGDRVIPARIADGARNQLVSGAWNATGVLLDAGDAIEATAGRLPYVKGF